MALSSESRVSPSRTSAFWSWDDSVFCCSTEFFGIFATWDGIALQWTHVYELLFYTKHVSYHTTHQACCLLVKSFVRRKQLATSQQCIQRHSNLFWSLKVSLFVKHRAIHKYTKYANTMLHNLSTALLSKFDAPKHKTLMVRTSPAGSRKHLQTWDTEAPIHFIFK